MDLRRCLLPVLLGTMICVSSIGTHAQDTRDSATSSAPSLTSESKKDSSASQVIDLNKNSLKSFEPGIGERVARGFQYEFDRNEQPGFVVISSGNTSQILPNPEHYINQHSLTFQFSELFLSPAELTSIAKQLSAENTKARFQFGNGKNNAAEYLVSAGPWWKRAIGGVTTTISLAERPGTQQGILVPNLPFSLHYGFTGQIDFDPTAMFITGKSWKDALDAAKNQDLETNDGCFARPEPGINPTSESNQKPKSHDCAAELATPRIRPGVSRPEKRRYLEALIPKFQFKRVSQFDFVKNSGILIPAPFPESGLNNYSFTWNLRRVIAPTSDRLAAETAFEAYHSQPKSQQPSEKMCITVSGISRNFVSVPDTFEPRSCKALALSIGADHFALACSMSDKVLIGKTVEVKDRETAGGPDQNSCGLGI